MFQFRIDNRTIQIIYYFIQYEELQQLLYKVCLRIPECNCMWLPTYLNCAFAIHWRVPRKLHSSHLLTFFHFGLNIFDNSKVCQAEGRVRQSYVQWNWISWFLNTNPWVSRYLAYGRYSINNYWMRMVPLVVEVRWRKKELAKKFCQCYGGIFNQITKKESFRLSSREKCFKGSKESKKDWINFPITCS